MSQEASQDRPHNPKDEVIKEMLSRVRRVAIVGLSPDESRDSNKVAKYLKGHGYQIIPVNPKVDEILGEKAYPSLKDIPEKVDVVDVFRKSEAVPEIANQAAAIGAEVLWLQLGVRHERAADEAKARGMLVIQDECMKVQHGRLLGKKD